MVDRIARTIVLAARPQGRAKETDFCFDTVPVDEPDEGEILLETKYLSLDPYMPARMDAVTSCAPYLEIGDIMVGHAVSKVVASKHPSFKTGDTVLAPTGWRTLSVINREIGCETSGLIAI